MNNDNKRVIQGYIHLMLSDESIKINAIASWNPINTQDTLAEKVTKVNLACDVLNSFPGGPQLQHLTIELAAEEDALW